MSHFHNNSLVNRIPKYIKRVGHDGINCIFGTVSEVRRHEPRKDATVAMTKMRQMQETESTHDFGLKDLQPIRLTKLFSQHEYFQLPVVYVPSK
jgi:hypothetical protein